MDGFFYNKGFVVEYSKLCLKMNNNNNKNI